MHFCGRKKENSRLLLSEMKESLENNMLISIFGEKRGKVTRG
jgi:hypothetical protein